MGIQTPTNCGHRVNCRYLNPLPLGFARGKAERSRSLTHPPFGFTRYLGRETLLHYWFTTRTEYPSWILAPDSWVLFVKLF